MLIVASDSTFIGTVLLIAVLALLVVWAVVLTRRPIVDGTGTSPATLSIFIVLAASAAAAIAWPGLRIRGFCDSEAVGAANIDYAAVLVLLCGLVGTVVFRAFRREPLKLAVSLLVAAALVGGGVVLVWLDSATYTVYTPPVSGDMFTCPDFPARVSRHVWYLYLVWGSAIALLLVQAVRAFRLSRLPGEALDDESDESRSAAVDSA